MRIVLYEWLYYQCARHALEDLRRQFWQAAIGTMNFCVVLRVTLGQLCFSGFLRFRPIRKVRPVLVLLQSDKIKIPFTGSMRDAAVSSINIERTVFRYSVDVLCNGSEYSSTSRDDSPTAALFLSIWKSSNACHDAVEDESQKLVARYGLDGVGSCDGLARIAADQQFKLGPVRALFLNPSSHGVRPHGLLSSIPSLLYANQLATMSMVVPNTDVEDSLEKLVQLVHGHQTYPNVATCVVPTVSSSSPSSNLLSWWKVYEDDQILVHAGRWDHSVDPEDWILYLFTFQCLLAANASPDSTLFFPSLQVYQRTICPSSSAIWQLPMVETAGIEPRLPRLGVTWVLRPSDKGPTQKNESGSSSLLHQNVASATLFLVTPFGKAAAAIDPGLLVRAQQQTHDWRDHCDSDMLCYFPYLLTKGDTDGLTLVHSTSLVNVLDHGRILLHTGTSIVIDIFKSAAGDGDDTDCHFSIRIVDRNQLRMHRKRELKDESLEGTTLSSCRTTWPSLLRNFLLPATDTDVYRDENEIDLDNFELGDSSKPPETGSFDSVPQLLVLGTGCASPSPYRGASGYALLLPTPSIEGRSATVAVAVEVGEGYCTQWHRYAGGRSFASIRMIWISHAHWDHYGGLVNLILRIQQSGKQKENFDCASNERFSKKQKSNDFVMCSDQDKLRWDDCPIVVAPGKVLKYLSLIFIKPDPYYRAVHLEDATMMKTTLDRLTMNSINPILQWRNVRVNHSCIAFGFILVLQCGQGAAPYVFCYSGDTRPCRDFVESCRAVVKVYKANGRVDFLLHEATFDEIERHMSISKKHSTTKEAVMVGRDVDSERLLLTHFSQRYDTVPDIAGESEHFHRRMTVGFALDGMKVLL
jgi:ribonuclease BN (tRNA processing enzyme)